MNTPLPLYESTQSENKMITVGRPSTDGPATSGANPVTTLLRWIGGTALMSAPVAFLLQRIDSFSDLERFYAFLVFSLLVTGLGLLCGLRLDDQRGSRVLMVTGAVLVPALGAQLGSIVYGVLGYPLPPGFPSWATMHTASPVAGSLAIVIGSLVAALTAYLSFKVLSRDEARRFTAVHLAMSGLLLLPVRSPEIVGPLALLATAFLLAFEEFKRLTGASASAGTLEAGWCRLLVLIAPVIMMARTAYLYSPDAVFVGLTLVLIGLITYFAGRGFERYTARVIGEMCGAALMAPGAAIIASSMIMDPTNKTTVGCISIGLVLYLCSLDAAGTGKIFRGFAVLSSLLVGGLVWLSAPVHLVGSALYMAMAIAMLVDTFARREGMSCSIAAVALATMLIRLIGQAIEAIDVSSWIALGGVGLSVMLLSSVIERYLPELRTRFAATVREFQ